MIQRKQTIFLLLASIAAGICGALMTDMLSMSITAFVVAAVSLINIFLYKKRKTQASVCLFTMILLLWWYLNLGIMQHAMNGSLELTWPMALPALSIVLVFMARKGIQADEKLVRSLDRIR